MNVVKDDLPPKTVFVIAVKLSSLQKKLYKRFLDVHGFTKDRVFGEKMRKRCFFVGYQALAQVNYRFAYIVTVIHTCMLKQTICCIQPVCM